MYRNKFLDMKQMPTCLAPWHCLTVKWGGNVVPDIIYKGKLGNINKQPLTEILDSKAANDLRKAHRKRIVPDECATCAKKEQSGRSRRMFFWDKIDYNVRMESEHLAVDTMPDIRYLDFTVSNKCNVACIHCGPFVSTGWTKDGKKLNELKRDYWGEQPIGFHGAEMDFMDNLFAEPLYFRNLQWVALRGGEPLYDERCIEVLQWFVDNGMSEHIMLDISTNATVFREEFLELFSKFKHVELLVSIEGTEELYSIIRGGKKYTWEDLNNNIEKFYDIPNLEMVFAVTTMITNVFNLPKVWEWFDKYHKRRASIAMTNVVVNPPYLNIAHMPKELKQQALEAISSIPGETLWPEGSFHAESAEYQTGCDDIRKGLQREVDEEEAAKYWKQFLQYTADLDRLRDTDTLQYIPEIKKYVQSQK